jgi:predicted Kef-type K+ transport protein
MRDAFAVLFFVSVGMLLDPRFLFEAPTLLLATLAVVMIGKPLVALVIAPAPRLPVPRGAVCGSRAGADRRALVRPVVSWT